MWRDITGFENRYQVNQDGQIRNASTLTILTSTLDKYGYLQIGLRKLSIRKKFFFKIHKLVALHFLEIPENLLDLQIDHIDRNKINNNYLNLRWVTQQENCDNRKNTAWKSNTTSGELYITKYLTGYMLRINRHNLKHRSWHKTLKGALETRSLIVELN
jgi:hypothetical protein